MNYIRPTVKTKCMKPKEGHIFGLTLSVCAFLEFKF